MIEEADRFTLTTGPDGRALLSLALRRHPRASADRFAMARRYWACVPGGAQPRWLGLTGGAGDSPHPGFSSPAFSNPGFSNPDFPHPDDAREATDAHAAAEAYLPGVCCSGCRDRQWKPVDRRAVTRYVLTGITGCCLTCQEPAGCGPVAAPVRASTALAPMQTVQAQSLPAVTVRIDGPAAALLWGATAGDMQTMSSLVTELVSRNFGIRRPTADML